MLSNTHFWSKVDIRGPDECWPWTKERDKRGGYGVYRVARQKFKAHRVAYELHTKRAPGSAHVLHSCDNPPCCNPLHLRVGTAADNAADRVTRGRTRSLTKITDAQVVDIRQRYAEGVSSAQLGRDFGISQQQAHRLATGRSRGAVPGLPKELRGRPEKISLTQVDQVRDLWESGRFYQSELAYMFGISQSHVSKLVNGKYR